MKKDAETLRSEPVTPIPATIRSHNTDRRTCSFWSEWRRGRSRGRPRTGGQTLTHLFFSSISLVRTSSSAAAYLWGEKNKNFSLLCRTNTAVYAV